MRVLCTKCLRLWIPHSVGERLSCPSCGGCLRR